MFTLTASSSRVWPPIPCYVCDVECPGVLRRCSLCHLPSNSQCVMDAFFSIMDCSDNIFKLHDASTSKPYIWFRGRGRATNLIISIQTHEAGCSFSNVPITFPNILRLLQSKPSTCITDAPMKTSNRIIHRIGKSWLNRTWWPRLRNIVGRHYLRDLFVETCTIPSSAVSRIFHGWICNTVGRFYQEEPGERNRVSAYEAGPFSRYFAHRHSVSISSVSTTVSS